MAQKQTKKAEQGKEPLKCTWKNCHKLQTGDGEFCEEHINSIDDEFEDIIRNKMTNKQFDKWVMSWIDVEEIIDRCLDWDEEEKREEIKALQKIIKK